MLLACLIRMAGGKGDNSWSCRDNPAPGVENSRVDPIMVLGKVGSGEGVLTLTDPRFGQEARLGIGPMTRGLTE